ncbi:MAG: hypothetical protein JWO05_2865 [Gemmatimonadetes bacterium]|nr:hypothetical protein [Gemmatimonadota bacterium]
MSYNPLSRFYFRKLDNLQRLSELVEDSLVAQATALDARLAAAAKDLPASEQQDFYEYQSEDYYELADELPTLLRYSVLTGADSGLEVFLNDTCETYANVHKASVSLGDLRGAGIERARDYLKKVARIPFPDTAPEWTILKRLHQLRNAIIHADGYIPPEKADVAKWPASIPGLRISNVGGISFAREFAGPALGTYRAFVEKFDVACDGLGLWHSVFPPIIDADH